MCRAQRPVTHPLCTSLRECGDLATQNVTYAGEDGCFAIDVPARARIGLSIQTDVNSSSVLLVDSGESGSSSDPASCSALPNIVADKGQVGHCPLGFLGCGPSCVDSESDPTHCGSCDQVCESELCAAASCVAPEVPGMPGTPDGGTLDGGSDPQADSGTGALDSGTEPDADLGPEVYEPADLYVDAVNGLDSNSGALAAPFRSISAALPAAVAIYAGSPIRVQVLPGLYDSTVESAFPIIVPQNVLLVGSESSRGLRGIGTTISGAGVQSSVTTALVVNGNSRLSGFRVISGSNTFDVGVLVENQGPAIMYNTFDQGYGGIATSGGGSYPYIEFNTFRVTGRGVYDCGGGTVSKNDFASTMAVAINITQGSCAIVDNNIEGSGVYGIQVQASAPYIGRNVFTRLGGFSAGAIYSYGAAMPFLRDNIFMGQAGNVIVTSSGSSAAPDLGTASDPGMNILGSGTAVGINQCRA